MEVNTRRSQRIQHKNIVPPISTLVSGVSGAASPEAHFALDSVSTRKAGKKLRSSKRQKPKELPQANSSHASQSPNTVAQEVCRPDPAWIRGRRGHLRLMPEVPLDVLNEIFSELEAIDLLRLSWACKSLHAIVMSKSAKYLWEGALTRLYQSENPPPQCPDDLNPAQYIRFLFVNKCMECGTNVGNWDSWALRLRVCWQCLQSDRFIPKSSIPRLQCTLIGVQAKKDVFYRVSDYKELRGTGVSTNGTHCACLSNMQGLWAYNSWKSRRDNGRKEKLESMRLKRRTIVLQKLDEIGWNMSEIQGVTDNKIDGLPGFARSKKLTDREWDTLRPKLIERLQGLKIACAEQTRRMELHRRYRAFEANFAAWARTTDLRQGLQPHTVDLAILEPFKSTIFTQNAAEINFSMAEIDRVAKKWLRSRYNFMLSLLPQELQTSISAQPKTAKDRAQDFLASALFRCDSSPFLGRRLNGPVHSDFVCCLRLRRQHFRHHDEPELSASLDILGTETPWEWDRPRITFDPEAHEVAKAIIALLGEDPNTATISQMQRCEGRLICLRCPSHNKMDYLSALEHEMSTHKRNWHKGVKWRVVDIDEEPDWN